MPSLEELNGRLIKVENEPGGGGGGSTVVTGTLTVTVPHNSFSHSQTVSVVGVLPAMKVMAQVAEHPDTEENDASMLSIVSLASSAGSGSITFSLEFGEPTSGPILINFTAS